MSENWVSYDIAGIDKLTKRIIDRKAHAPIITIVAALRPHTTLP